MRALLLSLVILLTTTGCGPRWYYPHLDWLLPWYVDDYITLAPGQQTDFQRRLARQLEWHCRTELPDYAAFLRLIQQDFEKQASGVSTQRFQFYYVTIRKYYNNLVRNIGPDVAAILGTASDAQIDQLFANLEERNRELAERYVEPPEADILDQRYERMVERIAEWIGELRTDQKTMVREWSRGMGVDNGLWIANRRHVQLELRRLLARRAASPDFESQFTEAIVSPPQTEAYRHRRDRRTARTLQLLTDIGRTLSRDQRRHFVARLGTLADDFDRLSCATAETAPRPGP